MIDTPGVRRVLAISSQVSCGHVGLSAIQPILHLFGVETIALPTITLSSHPAPWRWTGRQLPPELLAEMLAAIDENGWLAGVDAVLTGYLPSAGHVAVAADAIRRLRAARGDAARTLVDPVLGDDPKGVYIDQGAAEAIRDQLLPLADLATPNRFELAWLSGAEVGSPETAIAAARALPPSEVFAKSIPLGGEEVANIFVTPDGARLSRVALRSGAPKGTGDALSALLAAGQRSDSAIGRLQALIEASLGRDALAIIPAAPIWRDAAPFPEQALDA